MKTELIVIGKLDKDAAQIRRAGQILREGGLVAFPTETVYGLGGDALNPLSSRRIYAAKGRPQDNPLIVHICRREDLGRIAARIPREAEKLAERFWPGPLTMVLPRADRVPRETTGGLDTVAVRMPDHPVALALIDAAGGFVAAPSANTSGKPSPTLAKYVLEDMDGRIDMILDGGPVGIGLESTIVDMTSEIPTILRPGYITQEMLEETLGRVETDRALLSPDSCQPPKAPGMKYRHYAPAGELTVVAGPQEAVVEWINGRLRSHRAAGRKTGVICTEETKGRYLADQVKNAGKRDDEAGIARELYRILREFDDEQVEVMYSEAFDTAGVGQAVMNRLLKAAGHHVENVQ